MSVFDKRVNFKPLKGCKYHFIGDDLKIYRKFSTYFRELKGNVSKRGYKVFKMMTYKGEKTFLYHRLIAETFIPNPENKPCVNHKNGNKLDNKVENLEWCTHSENNKHAYATGLKVQKSKVSDSQVEEIRKLYNTEDISQVEIASRYNIHQVHVSRIIRRTRRSHGSI